MEDLILDGKTNEPTKNTHAVCFRVLCEGGGLPSSTKELLVVEVAPGATLSH